MKKDSYFNGSAKQVNAWSGMLLEPRRELQLDKSALLVIDMQKYFLNEDSHAFVPAGKAMFPNVQKILQVFRDGNRPIIFTRFAVKESEPDPISNWWKDSVVEGSPESELMSELNAQDSEKVIRKFSYSSFHGTDLEEYLRGEGVQDLVITGVLTNLCCSTAAREAFDRLFNVFAVIDAMATYSEEMHLGSIKNLSYGFASPITTQKIVS